MDDQRNNGPITNGKTAAEYRQARGAVLAKTKADAFRLIVGDTYLVPSAQAGGAGYVVDAAARTCTCPDFEERGEPCKHQWAIRYYRRELELPDGSIVVTEALQAIRRKTYAQNWPAYNRAQCEEKSHVEILLRALCDGIAQPRQERGRPRLALSDVVFGATMKVYTTGSGRRASTDIRSAAARGFMEHAPAYNSLFKYVERPALTPLFQALVAESAKPLRAIESTFAVDSTGFGTCTYTRWFDHKYGEEKRTQRWVKLHAAVGTVTNVITAARVTEANVNDSPLFAPLVTATKATGFDTREISADKAYLSHENLAAIEAVGALPFVPFKSNSGSTGSAAWEKMHHWFAANKDDFFAHYHARSNVESTFGAIKKKFGDTVRSKAPAAQFNEVLLKCLCFNLSILVHSIHELGIDPKFWLPSDAVLSTPSLLDMGDVGTEVML